MKFKLCILAGMIGMLIPMVQAFAHHAFAAEYDGSKTVMLRGVVTKFEWTNPHVRFYVDVKDPSGVTNWDLELQSPNTLTRNGGWTRHALKVGDEVIVTAYPAKDGSKRGNARGSVTLADGRKLFAGEPQGAR
jgi:hypothetical protein